MNPYLERCIFAQTDKLGRITEVHVTASPLVAENMLFRAARDPAVADTAIYEWPGHWTGNTRLLEWISLENPGNFCFIDAEGVVCEAPLSVR